MSVIRDLRQVLAELSLISHVSAAGPSRAGHQGKASAKPPRGGIEHRDDHERGTHLRSADHFLRRAQAASNEAELTAVLEDARENLAHWRHKPATLIRDTEPWKRRIVAEIERSEFTPKRAAFHYEVSPATVYRYLQRYGSKRAA